MPLAPHAIECRASNRDYAHTRSNATTARPLDLFNRVAHTHTYPHTDPHSRAHTAAISAPTSIVKIRAKNAGTNAQVQARMHTPQTRTLWNTLYNTHAHAPTHTHTHKRPRTPTHPATFTYYPRMPGNSTRHAREKHESQGARMANDSCWEEVEECVYVLSSHVSCHSSSRLSLCIAFHNPFQTLAPCPSLRVRASKHKSKQNKQTHSNTHARTPTHARTLTHTHTYTVAKCVPWPTSSRRTNPLSRGWICSRLMWRETSFAC